MTDTEDGETAAEAGDRFLVGIHVTDSDLQFVVHVPSEIDSGWRDPAEFQRLVERTTWEQLDQESTLRTIAASGSPGETITLGSVRLQPDGTLVSHTLSAPDSETDS
ncbi:MAG: hypothetical protein ACOC0Z_07300 [Halohasta sp.]